MRFMPSIPSTESFRSGLEARQVRIARQLAAIAVELREAWKDNDAAADALAQIAVFGSLFSADRIVTDSLPQPAAELLRTALHRLEENDAGAAAARLRALIESSDGQPFRDRRSTGARGVAEVGWLFEAFLHEYDRGMRRKRGVFFTPQEVVSYIVRSVVTILRATFANAPRIHVIDPACGCGIFLAEWIEQFRCLDRRQFPGTDCAQLIGFEVIPSTWLVSQLLLCPTASPIEIHLANPLDEGERWQEEMIGTADSPALPIIIGNPPYANFGRLNRSPWIRELLGDYKTDLDERKVNLDDDFIKFLRWGQHWIDRAGQGILAMITSNTYLRGLTHRRMRESLWGTFDDLYVLDLHGSTRRGDAASNSHRDENVFAIKTGVAIGVFVKRGRIRLGDRDDTAVIRAQHSGHTTIPTLTAPKPHFRFAEYVGSRTTKLAQLAAHTMETTPWTLLVPQAPAYLFAPAPGQLGAGYESFWPLDRIFREFISGVQTKNDAQFVGFTRDELATKVQQYLHPGQFDPDLIRPYLVAPFDQRWIYYDPRLLGRARHSVMRHMLRPNVGLVFMRQSTNAGAYDHFLAVDGLVSDRVFFSRHGAPFLAPLWLWGGQEKGGREAGSSTVRSTEDQVRIANFSDDFIAALAQRIPTSESTAPDIFHFLYAVAHSIDYRQTYAQQLRVAFPRLPLPRDMEEFRSLADIGRQLVELHLAPGSTSAGRTKYTASSPQPETQEATIGGYPVLRRWKKQRKNRQLTAAEQQYFVDVAQALQQTQTLMREITFPHSFSGSGT